MRYSKLLIPTLRKEPAESEAISHKLMIRGGFVRQLAAGLYIYLPLGWRVIDRINRIIREEMDAIGGQEVSMPVLHPAEIWQQTGRWYDIGDEMFRLKDRGGRDMCLGMTHEEVITWLAAKEIRSYRELPQIWYQIQTKLRDEARPKGGILRTREFLMKDSYSFDADEERLGRSYQSHAEAYKRVFERCGLKFYMVESDPGMMGGAGAHEFMAPSPAGEDEVVLCTCGYAANAELALSIPVMADAPKWEKELEELSTPDSRTIEEVSAFLKVGPRLLIKSLLLIGEKGPFMALVRGDQELHEKKLKKIAGEFRSATKEEVKEITGIEAGFIGPVGSPIPKIIDSSLKEGLYITGANKTCYHLRAVSPFRHFNGTFADIHTAKAGDRCPKCGEPLTIEKAIEVGNIFKLGTKYSIPLKAFYLDKEGKERPIIMGSYGIGPARIAAAAIEQNHDDKGIVWPTSIAPFQVHLLPINIKDKKVLETAEGLYRTMQKDGVEVLFDDRDESPGVKFNDADLIGMPYQLIIGMRNLKEGKVEVKERRTGASSMVKIEEVHISFRNLVSQFRTPLSL